MPVPVWRLQARRQGHSGLLELARAWQVSLRRPVRPCLPPSIRPRTSLAADQALTQVVNSELAAARATGKVMAILPGCGLGMGYLLGRCSGALGCWLGPLGWACLLGGVALACAGVLWIEALARQVFDGGVVGATHHDHADSPCFVLSGSRPVERRAAGWTGGVSSRYAILRVNYGA